MGLPEIRISFQKAAATAVERSQRGTVAVILDDSTIGGELVTLYKLSDAKATMFTAQSIDYLRLIFAGGANTVYAVRLQKEESEPDLDATLEMIKPYRWNWLCMPGATSAEVSSIEAFIKTQRADGRAFKAVLPNATANDCEGIVNFATTGIQALDASGAAKAYSTAEFCCRIAGILAGLSITRSCTYYVLEDVVNVTMSEDPDADVDAGKLIIIFDGEKHKIARGVTALSGANANEDFKKIKIVEGRDLIAEDIKYIFEDNYVGQAVNDYDNKQLLVSNIDEYLQTLTGSVLSPDFDNTASVNVEAQRKYLEAHGTDTSAMSDIEVCQANTDSSVFVLLSIQLIDAMEDMLLDVALN